ncbi:MAG: threonine dehydratase [Planctomycetes bacterium]|nr:threonine dehydratase [Planctomycetota bacterium]
MSARGAPSLEEIEEAAAVVHAAIAPTPQIRWPLLSERAGAEVWVKHENHTPIGSFKIRGGVLYLHELLRRGPRPPGVIAATRGNHGQSVAYAARLHGLPAVLVVPHGNSRSKNAAMRALGAELVEHGHDFQAAYERLGELAAARGLHAVPSFHPTLVLGITSYPLELFRAVREIDAVYVPIGLGSGICAVIAARNALGLRTRVVGVVAEKAPAYALSFARGEPVATSSADTIADGVACRVPDPEAFAIIRRGADRIVAVSEDEIRAAVRGYFDDTHNAAEGAGAAPLAALLKERAAMAGRRVALDLTGSNVDREVYREMLEGAR